jgi:hypothetical protein
MNTNKKNVLLVIITDKAINEAEGARTNLLTRISIGATPLWRTLRFVPVKRDSLRVLSPQLSGGASPPDPLRFEPS